MEDLKGKRQELDRQIAELYKERMQLNETIADANEDLKTFINQAIANSPETFPDTAYVACQGVQGSFSQEAAERLFKHPDLMFFKNWDGVFASIENGLCEYGVLPIENSTAGSVNRIYDLMVDHKFYIVRSTRLKVTHNLLAKPGTKLSEIREVISHDHAIAQCDDFIRGLGDVKVTSCGNTAEAAKMVSEAEGKSIAAISSVDCAEIYGLEVLKTGIQDHDNNYTKFICISKTPQIYPGADKTSIMATIPHKPGSLYRILGKFEEKGYNLVKLESRPIPDTEFEFMFYFDFEASIYHPEFSNTISELAQLCDTMEYLGSYTEKI